MIVSMAGKAALVAVLIVLAVARPALAADCSKTSTGMIPIADLGSGTYKGEQGGLYPGGTNVPPAQHLASGLKAATAITPRDAAGNPATDGKIVLLSIGMSNTTAEFAEFVRVAAADPAKSAAVVVVDAAKGGQDVRDWSDPNAPVWTAVEPRLKAAGVTAAQVQAVWLKQARSQPTGDFPSSSAELQRGLETNIANAVAKFPNLSQVYMSSRTYAGYAITKLNPEPYAYESAFAVKRLIAAHLSDSQGPWIGWGPQLWADGENSRSDGFKWTCADLREDGVHPTPAGAAKIAGLLQVFFAESEFSGWYRGEVSAAAQKSGGGEGVLGISDASAPTVAWIFLVGLSILTVALLGIRSFRKQQISQSPHGD